MFAVFALGRNRNILLAFKTSIVVFFLYFGKSSRRFRKNRIINFLPCPGDRFSSGVALSKQLSANEPIFGVIVG